MTARDEAVEAALNALESHIEAHRGEPFDLRAEMTAAFDAALPVLLDGLDRDLIGAVIVKSALVDVTPMDTADAVIAYLRDELTP